MEYLDRRRDEAEDRATAAEQQLTTTLGHGALSEHQKHHKQQQDAAKAARAQLQAAQAARRAADASSKKQRRLLADAYKDGDALRGQLAEAERRLEAERLGRQAPTKAPVPPPLSSEHQSIRDEQAQRHTGAERELVHARARAEGLSLELEAERRAKEEAQKQLAAERTRLAGAGAGHEAKHAEALRAAQQDLQVRMRVSPRLCTMPYWPYSYWSVRSAPLVLR